MKRIIDKQTNLFLRDDFTYDEETEIALDVEPAQGFYKPKWNGTVWEEGATEEHVESLTTPTEPTAEERLEALEGLMLEMLGGGF